MVQYCFAYQYCIRFTKNAKQKSVLYTLGWYLSVADAISIGGITVLCHFRKNDLLHVIICKNDMHLATLYNVIFSNLTGILSHLNYILYYQKKGSNVPLKWNVLGNLSVWPNQYTNCYFFFNFRTKTSFWTKWDRYNIK